MSDKDNIIPLRDPDEERGTDPDIIDCPSDEELQAIMARNAAKEAKRKADRAKANKSVLRSYRIKY